MLIPLGFFGGAGAISWVNRTWANSGRYEYSHGLFGKADKTAVALGWSDDTTAFTIYKYNEDGTVASVLRNNNAFPNGMTSPDATGGLDSSENLYAAGWSYQNGGFFYPAITKWNSSLGITYSYWWNPGYYNSQLRDCRVNASGNMAISYFTNNNHPVLFYVTAAGDIQYGIRMQTSSAYPIGVGISPSNNSYFAWASAGTHLIKLNTSGTVQWYKKLNQAIAGYYTGGMIVDSSEYAYVAALNDSYYPQVSKWDSAGNKIWESVVNVASDEAKLAIDETTGDVFILSSQRSPRYFVITKMNSSGVIQWTRVISSVNNCMGSTSSISIKNGAIHLGLNYTNTAGNVEYAFKWKVPTDGSGAGTYTVGGVAHTYAAGSFTSSTVLGSWSNWTFAGSAWGVMGTKTNTGSTQAAITRNTSTVQL